MRNLALCLALLLPVSALAAAPAPFSAEYSVFQNDKKLGEGTVSLRRLPDGRFELTTRTQATEGLVAAAGVRRSERSVIDWTGARPESVEYRMEQKAGWSDRRLDLQVDAGARRVTSTYRDETTTLPYTPGMLERHGLTAVLMAELAAGKRGDLEFTVAERRGVEQQRYRVAANVVLQTAIGPQRAVRVERVRDDGSGRITKIWFARERGWLPLRIKQYERDGDTFDMRITAIR